MDRTPDSVHAPSRSQLRVEGTQSFETTPTYFSPVSTTESQRRGPAASIGLGISTCGLETLDNHLRIYSPSQHASTMPQLVPGSMSCEFPLQGDDLSNEPSFEIYRGGANASESPLSLYSTQALSASPTYSSTMEFCSSQEAFCNPLFGLWTPAPETTTPPEAVTMEDDVWGPQLLPDACVPVATPVTPVTNGPYHPTTLMEDVGNAYTGQIYARPGALKPMCLATLLSDANRTAPPMLNTPSVSGLECPVCGYTFTRRSNFREHLKKHDPNFQKTHPCVQCPKSFTRKADLRRHVDSVC